MNNRRAGRIQMIKEQPEIDVLIVGAGINGIGTFYDLALQGVNVLLIDRGDYCSGASSASSHMVHGGIRYLENGEFRLVREAVQERNRLIENAPHLVKPLATTFPIFKIFSGLLNAPLKFLGLLNKPSERGALVIKIGMLFYDFYTRKQKTVPQHVFENREKSLKSFPALNPEVIFTGTYYDGSMPSPERIAIEILQDAIAANEHAIALNYVSMHSATDSEAVLKDEITGERLTVRPKVVVNAGGAWIDQVNQTFGRKTEFIGGTKGSHLVLAHPELRAAIKENEFFFENQDGRIVLIFPFEDKVLIGASDIKINDPDKAVVTDEEVAYFFGMIEKVFPEIKIDHSHIVFTFSGVRPLPATKANSTGQISRDHKLIPNPPDERVDFPIYSLVGGKWTTYRAFSEETCNVVLQYLGTPRIMDTKNLKIGGGNDYPINEKDKELFFSELLEKHNPPEEYLETLFIRYGTNARKMLENTQPLVNYPDMSIGELAYILEQEDVVHLDDLILRRSMIGMLGRVTRQGLEELADVAGTVLGWDEVKIRAEIDRTSAILRNTHRMDFLKYLRDSDLS